MLDGGADVHDPAEATLDHPGQDRPDQQIRSTDIGGHDLVPLLDGQILDRLQSGDDAGIVDENLDRPRLLGLFQAFLHRLRVRHIHFHRHTRASGLGHLLGGLLDPILSSACTDDFRPRLARRHRQCLSQSRARSGNQDDFIF